MEQILLKALKEAGKVLMDKHKKVTGISIKESQSSIVTEADLLSEKIILEIIQNAYPQHNIISEEKGYIYNHSEYSWIIDPLDGTSNFAAVLSWFGILIALLKNDEVILAGAFLPFYNWLYTAKQGKGAYMNMQKISVSNERDLKKVLFSYSIDFSENDDKINKELQLIKLIVKNTRNLRATNCLVDLCNVAEGKTGGCMNHTMKIWDIAAPYLIIKEAGGVVTEINGKQYDFKTNSENYTKNYTVLAANQYLHEKILSLTNSLNQQTDNLF